MISFLNKTYQSKLLWVNIAFLPSKTMQTLHHQFTKKNNVTDVLSFPDQPKLNNQPSGDIAICLDVVLKQAPLYKKTIPFLIYETILHGILHLYGLRHDYKKKSLEKIYQQQEIILNKIKLNWSLFDAMV